MRVNLAYQGKLLLFLLLLLSAGTSSYTRHLNYRKFREVADLCGALLMADMAHVSGLVAAGVSPSPFEHCDLVTTTTHKTMAGPRGAMIYYKKGTPDNYISEACV